MGQQQLLLIVLVTIVVGIATVVAISIVSTGFTEANRDAVRQDLVSASVMAQAAWARPLSFNGAGSDYTNKTEGEIMAMLQIPSSTYDRSATNPSAELENEHGVYTLTNRTEASIELSAEPVSGGTITATISRDETTSSWSVILAESF